MDEIEAIRRENAVLKQKIEALRQRPKAQMVSDDFRRGQPDVISQIREAIYKAQMEGADPWAALGIRHDWNRKPSQY